MTTPQHSPSLYVGDLHEAISENTLHELFRTVGPVSFIRVCRDHLTKRSLGYAYVNFQSSADAERALETLNYAVIKGKPIRIMWSQRDPSVRKSGIGNIFIKNLDKTIDNKALFDTFSAFGHILSCKVSTKQGRKGASSVDDDDKVNHRGYGFVHFETQEDAELAISKVNGMLLNGKQVYVGPFIKRSERLKHVNVEDKYTNVFVKNLDKSLSKEEFDKIFSEFGEIQHSDLAYDEQRKSKGFGFVNYVKHEDAVRAVNEKNDKEVMGKKIFVARHQTREERQAIYSDMLLKRRFDAKKIQGTNLYIKNLDDSFDDAKLKEVFSPYGNITSAKVMMRDEKPTQSKGFGFVNFENPEDATKALEMNGKIVGSKPLYVAYAQKKEVRRLQLQAQFNNRAMPYNNVPPYPAQMGFPQHHMGMYPPRFPPHPSKPRFTRAPPQQLAPMQFPATNQFPMSYAQAISSGGPFPHNMPQPRIGVHPSGTRRPYRGPQPQPRPGSNSYKFNQNARNRPDQQAMPLEPQQISSTPQQAVPQPELQLNLQNLADFPPEQQKDILGDRLYALVCALGTPNADRITGMFLEMDVSEVLHLIEDPQALAAKVQEASSMLGSAPVATN